MASPVQSKSKAGPDTAHWVKDEFVLACEGCASKFSVSRRKHHCRSCGGVFDARCASKYAELPELGYKRGSPQRVCESCFTKATMRAEQGAEPALSADAQAAADAIEGLKRLYRRGIKPLELQFKFGDFFSPMLTEADFDAKPMVLVIGPYSVGKSTTIAHLVGREFPGIRIGPEPTTDRFVVVAGTKERRDSVIPGNALAVQADRPFRSLQRFGAAFLDKLECAETSTVTHGGKAAILEHLTFVDSPGILSGEKQRIGRSYDYTGVVEWFAGRCDRILLLFDAHKVSTYLFLETVLRAHCAPLPPSTWHGIESKSTLSNKMEKGGGGREVEVEESERRLIKGD